MIKLKQVNGSEITLNLDEDLQAHFADNDKNHGHTIVNQINEQRFYNRYFDGLKDLTVLDLGSNIGLFALHVEPACKKIVAYEPTPSHYEKNLKLTAGTKIETRQVALSNTDGEAQFNLDSHNTTMNGLVAHHSQGTVAVKTLTLASILKTEKLKSVDIAKIDIEGSEMIALTDETVGAVKGKIKKFFVEFHPTHSYNGKNQQENGEILMDIFRRNDYEVVVVNFETFVATYKGK